jgi:hypothetical protein
MEPHTFVSEVSGGNCERGALFADALNIEMYYFHDEDSPTLPRGWAFCGATYVSILQGGFGTKETAYCAIDLMCEKMLNTSLEIEASINVVRVKNLLSIVLRTQTLLARIKKK